MCPDRAIHDDTIVFGHWSTLGLLVRHDVICLDTGCVWGGKLTALRLAGQKSNPGGVRPIPGSNWCFSWLGVKRIEIALQNDGGRLRVVVGIGARQLLRFETGATLVDQLDRLRQNAHATDWQTGGSAKVACCSAP